MIAGLVGLDNYDSSFFIVEPEGLNKDQSLYADISAQVLSFEVTEEMGKVMHGTLSLLDTDDHMLSFILKMGRKVKVSWGYKRNDMSGREVIAKRSNATELFLPGLQKRSLIGRIKDPSGSGGSDGKIVYNCNFMAYYPPGTSKPPTTQGTRDTWVRSVMTELGISPSNQFVKFQRGREVLSWKTGIRRSGMTPFRALGFYANEWRCLFRIAYSKDDQPCALFCDYADEDTINFFVNKTVGSFGSSVLLDYKLGKANVKSYSWNFNSSDGTTGDGARIVPDGRGGFSVYRYRAETQVIDVYVMNPGAIRKRLRREGRSPGSIMSAVTELMSYDNMDDLVRDGYFKISKATTAPQGIGLSANVESIGDIKLTAPGRIKFGEGFPHILRAKKMRFYLTKVVHRISRQGYQNSLTIADGFSLSQGSLVR